ncbi:hypothetical protein [uncultured Boseongicola sp.]|jgi:hypothetical protein|uniref:hypothetical protein n=1 Tax=uncultured Boseongicola sp. TaxID=1648499 RepID=UPI00262920CE|nr:hypothetical protein [uncultured Boseongicola sp.]
MNFRGYKHCATASLLILLVACAQPADEQAMVPASISPVSSASTYRGAVSDVTGYGGEETNPLWTSEISSDAFQTALKTSLQKAGIFSESGPFTLRADILSVDQPMVGFDLTVKMSVRYNLIDARGRIRFDRTITSKYTLGVSDEFLAIERLRKVNEGAARENISQLLKVLGAQVSTSSVGLSS